MRDHPVLLFLCPRCNKYTVHRPRLTLDGRWMVDHKLIEQTFCGDVVVTIPYSYCEVSATQLNDSRCYTRTVIRV